MMYSENKDTKYSVSISFNQNIEGLHLNLVDGNFNSIYLDNADHLTIDLFQGVYQLKVNFIDYYQEYVLIIDEESVKAYHFDFDYPFVAPIAPIGENEDENLEHYSQTSTTADKTEKPNFLFFGAKYVKCSSTDITVENHHSEYSVYNKENELLFEFNSSNSHINEEQAWSVFSTKLTNGLYLLKWSGKSGTRIFSFYVFEGYQTQFFIRYTQNPDFDNCFFFYTNKMSFSYNAEEYLVLDKILFAYKEYKNYELLTEKDRSTIEKNPYLVSLVYILRRLLSKPIDFKESTLLLLPDIHLLSLDKNAVNDKGQLPIISTMMTRFFVNQKSEGMTFKPGSLIDRAIDHMNFDLFWNNFSKIDDVSEWNDIYSKFIQNSKPYSINNDDNQIIKLSKSLGNMIFSKAEQITQNERLNTLLGDNLGAEGFESKIKDVFNSIGDVSQIADKLNLPPTTVLRNYDTYKNIFNKLK